jgi:hypothetical protein
MSPKGECSIIVKKDFWSLWWKAVWRSYQCKASTVETYRFDWQGTSPISIHAFQKDKLIAIIKANAFIDTQLAITDPTEKKGYALIKYPAVTIGFDYDLTINVDSATDGIQGDFYPSLLAALVGMKTWGKH